MVVVPEPAVKCLRPLLARAVDRSVGPAGEQGADEALGLAVCLRPVGTGAAVADPEFAAGERVQGGDVGGAVLEVNLSSGRQDSVSISLLEPSRSGSWVDLPPYLKVVVGERSDDWPPAEGEHVIATVTFSDIRGVATYRQTRSVDLLRSEQPGGEWAVSFQNPTESTEMRITPLPAGLGVPAGVPRDGSTRPSAHGCA